MQAFRGLFLKWWHICTRVWKSRVKALRFLRYMESWSVTLLGSRGPVFTAFSGAIFEVVAYLSTSAETEVESVKF